MRFERGRHHGQSLEDIESNGGADGHTHTALPGLVGAKELLAVPPGQPAIDGTGERVENRELDDDHVDDTAQDHRDVDDAKLEYRVVHRYPNRSSMG